MVTGRLERVPAPVLVLTGVVSVQFGAAVAITLIASHGSATAVLLRLGIGALLMVAFARPALRGHTPKQWRSAVTFGVILALMNSTFYAALGRIPLGVAVTLEFLGPLLLAAWTSRRRRDLAAVVAALAGVVLISGAWKASWERLDHLGLALALLAGVFWALYIIWSGRTGAAFPGVTGLTVSLVVAAVLCLPLGAAGLVALTGLDLGKGVLVALLSSVVPYGLELIALRRMSAQVFGVLMSTEPALGALAGLLVLGQRLAGWQVAGMALVVLASAVVLGSRRGPGPEPAEAAADLG